MKFARNNSIYIYIPEMFYSHQESFVQVLFFSLSFESRNQNKMGILDVTWKRAGLERSERVLVCVCRRAGFPVAVIIIIPWPRYFLLHTHTHSAQLIVICCWPCVFVVGGIRPQFRPLCYTKDVVLRVPRSRNSTKGNKQTKSTLLSSFSSSFIGFQSQPHQNSFEFDFFWSSLFSHFSGSTIGAKTKNLETKF